MDAAARRRTWRRVGLVVGIAVVVGAVLGALPHGGRPVDVIGAALALGGFAGVAALFPTWLTAQTSEQDLVRGMPTRLQRQLVRRVVSGDATAVDPVDRAFVTAFAEQFVNRQVWAITWSALLFAAMIGTKVFSWGDGSDDFLIVLNVLTAGTIGAGIVVLVWAALRLRRAQVFLAQARSRAPA